MPNSSDIILHLALVSVRVFSSSALPFVVTSRSASTVSWLEGLSNMEGLITSFQAKLQGDCRGLQWIAVDRNISY